jgi:GH15 family glucan-1,4-alpha-glucosidase
VSGPAVPAGLPIGAYGVIGDRRTAALVGTNGSLDWWCAPRFDSPAMFGALLDDANGGRWRIAPRGAWTSEQRYLPATNILVTTFHLTAGAVVTVTDLMPEGAARGPSSAIHRRIACTRGTAVVDVLCAPRFGFGLRRTTTHRRRHGILATDEDREVITVAATPGVTWEVDGPDATTTVALAAGESAWLVLRHDDDEVRPVNPAGCERALDVTAAFWDGWLSAMRYDGPFRQQVARSALALALCTDAETGAIIAAPTTSLPELQGGSRNWDYRYVWLRDAAFVLYALDRAGFGETVDAFLTFFKRVCRRAGGGHLQIMFGVDGRRDLPETTLEHLAGYRGARPVRVGNGAARQFQLDVYGELLETVARAHRGREVTEGLWRVLHRLVDWTAAHWREPDFSIWESRQEPKDFVFSKVMAWVALERAIHMAGRYGLPGAVETWKREAAAVHAAVLSRGWDADRQTFVQAFGEPQLDAAALIIPKVGFLRRSDPRVRSTIDAVRRELASSCEELIYRYRAPDGESGGEGAFVVCSFWVAQALAMVGDVAEAERLFRNLLRHGNHLGLFAEEIDPATGEQLGNFPQALSHAALINTAVILERLRPPPAAPAP